MLYNNVAILHSSNYNKNAIPSAYQNLVPKLFLPVLIHGGAKDFATIFHSDQEKVADELAEFRVAIAGLYESGDRGGPLGFGETTSELPEDRFELVLERAFPPQWVHRLKQTLKGIEDEL
jgi:hypothetical protein